MVGPSRRFSNFPVCENKSEFLNSASSMPLPSQREIFLGWLRQISLKHTPNN